MQIIEVYEMKTPTQHLKADLIGLCSLCYSKECL